MIETHNPEINVDDIMEKIREEVAKRREGVKRPPQPERKNFPASRPLPPFPWQQVQSGLNVAQHFKEVGTANSVMQDYPKPIRWLALLAGRMVLHITQPISFPQRRFNQAILQTVRTLLDAVRDSHRAISERFDGTAALEARMNELTAIVEQKADRAEVSALAEAQKADRAEVSALAEAQKADRAEVSALAEAQKADRAEVSADIQDILRQIRDHKLNIVEQERRLRLLLEEARKRLPEPISTEQIETMLTEEDHLLNAMYVSFEDQFRGTREDIKDRQKVYLPYIQSAGAGTQKKSILDVGCGRGEWLELCRDNELLARGIDINRVMVSQCLEHDLDVVEIDFTHFLREQTSGSFGAITGFHLVEHLTVQTLVAFLDEVLRVLKPGGIVIFETPNPENLLTGACNFYMDITHRNPLPPLALQYLVEARGFIDSTILRLHENKSQHIQDDMLQNFLFGPQDYAIIARKAD